MLHEIPADPREPARAPHVDPNWDFRSGDRASYPGAMSETAQRLRAVTREWTDRLRQLEDSEASRAPAPGKWSPKELVGHLIDSASVNLERFLRARSTDDLELPGYPHEEWVVAGRYSKVAWDELIDLWRLMNQQVARVIEGTPKDLAHKPRSRHTLDAIAFVKVPREEAATLEYMMRDYVAHLEHHLAALERRP